MKKISYLCSTYLISCATLAYANIFSPDTHLSVYTKSTTSVAESSDFIKLAAVYPMMGNSGMTFKAPKATSCASGYESYNGKCYKKCDRKVYPYASQPSSNKGTFSSCTGITTYYGYTSCNTGWTLVNHKCVESDCSGYPLTEEPSKTLGTVTNCKSGTNTYYKYTSCNDGWTLVSGRCEVKNCSTADYPYPSNPGEDAGTIKSCKTGFNTWYGYTKCNTGWVKSGSYCNKAQCNTTTYPYTTQGQAIGCNSVSECKSGTDSYYGCIGGCKSGYVANETQCIINQCTDYYPSSEITNCKTKGNSCNKGGTTVYKCTECNSGYELNSLGKCDACTWNGYTLTACPANATCDENICGGATKYSQTGCQDGYELKNGSCQKKNNLENCQIGDIYYADDTCSSTVVTGKTPIGVVYDTQHKLVMELIYKNLTFGAGELKSCTGCANAIAGDRWGVGDIGTSCTTMPNWAGCDMNGQANTEAYVALSRSLGQIYKAPYYCHTLPIGGKQWFLPSGGQMTTWFSDKDQLNISLNKVHQAYENMDIATDAYQMETYDFGYMLNYWSSSQLDEQFAQTVLGNGFSNNNKGYPVPVRCVFHY